ncbi:MAG: hypothetical protein AAGF20_03545 [Pseudomonadota bacterium]
MDTPESLLAAPLAISIFIGAKAMLGGQQGETAGAITNGPAPSQLSPQSVEAASALPLDPIGLLIGLAALLITGGILVALEMRAEANDRK